MKKTIKKQLIIAIFFAVVSTMAITATTVPAAASVTGTSEPVSISGPETVEPGTTAVITFTVTNTGESASGQILAISTPKGWEIVGHADNGGSWKASEEKWLWQTINAGS